MGKLDLNRMRWSDLIDAMTSILVDRTALERASLIDRKDRKAINTLFLDFFECDDDQVDDLALEFYLFCTGHPFNRFSDALKNGLHKLNM